MSSAQGLSQSSINAIFQDKQGFLWFGTSDGLSRYDGYGFTNYRHRHQDTTSLPAGEIETLGEDSDYHLWVGTASGGLSYLNLHTNRFVNVPLRVGNQPILSASELAVDGHDVWVGSNAAGLFHIDSQTNLINYLYRPGGGLCLKPT